MKNKKHTLLSTQDSPHTKHGSLTLKPEPRPMRPDPRPGTPPNAEPKEIMDDGKCPGQGSAVTSVLFRTTPSSQG